MAGSIEIGSAIGLAIGGADPSTASGASGEVGESDRSHFVYREQCQFSGARHICSRFYCTQAPRGSKRGEAGSTIPHSRSFEGGASASRSRYSREDSPWLPGSSDDHPKKNQKCTRALARAGIFQ